MSTYEINPASLKPGKNQLGRRVPDPEIKFNRSCHSARRPTHILRGKAMQPELKSRLTWACRLSFILAVIFSGLAFGQGSSGVEPRWKRDIRVGKATHVPGHGRSDYDSDAANAGSLDGMLTRYGPNGLAISSMSEFSPYAHEDWHFGLRLIGFSRGNGGASVGHGVCYPSDGGVAYAYENLTDWYIDLESGIEHLIDLQARPRTSSLDQESEPLELRFALAGDLCPVVQPGGRGMILFAKDHTPVLSYSDLLVWDSQGRQLEAFLRADDAQISICVDDSSAQYPIVIDPLIGIMKARLAPTDFVPKSNFGSAMGLDGATLAVSATGLFSGGPRGATYVYEKIGDDWVREARLISNAPNNDQFGFTLSVSGDTVAVGAIGASDFGPGSGAVFIFVRAGNQWIQQARLIANDGIGGAAFGSALSLQQDRLVVGAGGDDDQGARSGSVYVFERVGATWLQTAKLLASNGQPNSYFGNTVDHDGDLIVVGAVTIPIGGPVYVFRRTTGGWSQEAIIPPILPTNGTFGFSLSTSNERIAIGELSQGYFGLVHIFAHGGGNWSHEVTLQPVDLIQNNEFAAAIDLVNDQLLVGSPGAGFSGAAYVFKRTSGVWSQIAKLVSLNAAGGFGGMGYSVALGTTISCVGNPLDGQVSFQSGAAYIFELAEAYSTYCTAKTNSLGCSPTMAVQGSASASAAQGMLVSCSDCRNNTPGLLMYSFAGRTSTPFQGGFLCLSTPIHRTLGQNAGGSPSPVQDCSGVFSIDMNAFARGALGGSPRPELSVIGAVVQCQWWGRDQGFLPPFNSMLSDAVEYTIAQ